MGITPSIDRRNSIDRRRSSDSRSRSDLLVDVVVVVGREVAMIAMDSFDRE